MTKCGACGKAFTRDEEYPGLEERACECTECPKCGREFLADDDDGVQIAATDELAAKFDPADQGMCGDCWEERTK